jgi:hypothetical protein
VYYSYNKCGDNLLPFYGGKAATLITDNREGVVFYEKVDSSYTGGDYEVSGDHCYDLSELGFEPMCIIYIVCRKVMFGFLKDRYGFLTVFN